MNRINFQQQAIHLGIFVLLQIPMLYRLVLFDKAFGFFYVGFLLFLPYGLSRSVSMVIAFFTGLLIDVFSNTPGIHASACIFLVFVKDFWFNLSQGVPDENLSLDWNELKVTGTITYLFPLVLVHHFTVFTVENGGFALPGLLLSKVFLSALYSWVLIVAFSFLAAPQRRRL